MRHSAPRLILVSFLSVGTFIAACGGDNSTPSIPNYTIDGSVAPGVDAAVDEDAMPPEDAADAADAAPVVCPDVSPDDATGIYVTTSGTDGAACGTRAAPCKTVANGLLRAVATSKAQVNVAPGTYPESVTLAAGIEVVGGWSLTGTTWKRACTTPGQITILKAPAAQNTTVTATDLGGEAKLSFLRIESKAAASVLPGESLYGILAIGGTTTLTLKDVNVDVVAAGAGTSPAKAADGAPVAGTCAAGAGGVGAPGVAGPGAVAGSFGPAGYTPAAASAGAAGGPGGNGVAPVVVAAQCIQCGTCSAFADLTPCTFTKDPAFTCGTNGSSGCGGNPGQAGQPGTGGGSSVGIFAWEAAVTTTGGSVKSGDGGNGAAGGAGGAGSAGSVGVKGAAAPAPCITACGAIDPNPANLACLPNTMMTAAGGAAGGTGAPGGAGGAGGGGGGGSSYATYQGSTSVITSSGTTYAHGKAGAGGGAGASAGAAGTAADRYP